MDGTDVDDAGWPVGLPGVIHHRLGGEENALEIDVQNPVVFLLGDVPERRVHLDAGVVHQDVEFAEVIDRGVDEVLHPGSGRHVGLHDQAAPPGRLDCGENLVGTARAAVVVDNRVRPLAGKSLHNAPPDALAAARHHGYFPRQSHGPSSC